MKKLSRTSKSSVFKVFSQFRYAKHTRTLHLSRVKNLKVIQRERERTLYATGARTRHTQKTRRKTKQNGRKGISRVCEEGQGQGEGRGILMAGEYSHDSWGHWQTITRTCVRVQRTSSDEDIRRTWPLVWIMDICVYYGYNGLITFDCVRDRANNGAHINRAGSLAVCVCAHTFSCNCL